MTKSSLPDMRPYDPVANFSRPRKNSVRQPPPEPLNLRSSNFPPPNDPRNGGGAHFASRTPPWQRTRGYSAASSNAPSNFTHGQPHHGDGTSPTMPRFRNPAGPPPSRPHYGNVRYDGVAPPPGGAATVPRRSGDDRRTSYRSQRTTSTGPGTAVTERSSVLTKDSSVTSLDANADEPSLEDFLGMYEEGFGGETDDDVADAEVNSDSRPTTSASVPAQLPRSLPIMEEDMDDLPPLPPPPSLDAEIRQSKLFFTSPAFINLLPHIANSQDDDDFQAVDKRDSDKSVYSDKSDPPYFPTSNTVMSHHDARTDESMSSPTTSELQQVRESIMNAMPPVEDSELEEPEVPGSRDRYGFKKENQYINRKQYDAWDAGYSEYLARRKKKWVGYLKESALMTDKPNRFPAPNPKTKKFVRKGIPPEWRGAAWFYYAGGPAILAKHGGLYGKLLRQKARREDVDAIERDLHRTFPDNHEFKPPRGWKIKDDGTDSQSTSSEKSDAKAPKPDDEPPIISSLRRVLFAFSIYNPNIGYCQSLNFLAGLLLLFVDTEEQCFWLLNVITHIYLPGTHEISLEGSRVDLGVLMTEIRDSMPGVWDKIGGELEGGGGTRFRASRSLRKANPLSRRKQDEVSTERLPPITLCMTAWFMSCFIGTLPIETTLRVWDIFFYEGSKTLFRVALAIFKLGESEIKAVRDPMEMFGVVQAIPRRMIDANAVIEASFKRRSGFGHLSQGAIDERRQERRDLASQEKHKHASAAAGPTSGSLTEAESDVRRRGTLFGRRKKNREPSRTRAAEV